MFKARHFFPAWLPASLVVALGSLTPWQAAFSASAEELFSDGNRLYRDDLYWAALLRYQQAADAGLDSSLLHYNTGVAHYRAGQFPRAGRAFERAASDPGLLHIARYNLGLTSMAAGERRTALDWFRQVEAQQSRPQLAALATLAIARLDRDDREQSVGDEPEGLAPLPRPHGFSVRALLGFGSDDNAYRSPDEEYRDRTQSGAPLTVPIVQSGAFYPYDVTAKYTVNSFEHESFFGRYRVAGRYYQDPELSIADTVSHEVAFGTEYRRRSENRERRIRSAFTVAQHSQTWFDPDDGTERNIDGEDIGERLSYMRYGPEVWARQSFSRLSLNVHFKGQIWNYENSDPVPEYDHEYLKGGLSVQYRFTSTSLLRLEGDVYQRRFGDRRAFELDGTQRIDSETLRYDYLNYGATARQRVTRAFWFGLRYAHTTREDKYVGYNDYVRDSYGADMSLRISDKFRIRIEGWYHIYNYTNALAYHDPAAGRKTMESADGRITARWQLSNHLGIVGSFEYDDTASNDHRIDYTRSQFMLGLRWEQ
ncbi:MAG: hypothetical protein RIA65_01840 [Woeseia sp.]